MSIKIIKGNLFNSKAQTLVNTINTVGAMGTGIALEFRLRYPDMFNKYVILCSHKQIQVGKLWLHKTNDKWILNFPTKENWKDDSKIEYLEKGLQKFLDTYKQKGIISIAFPTLGARHGNIPEKLSIDIMTRYLKGCNIPIEIYIYDPETPDDIYENLKNKMINISYKDLKEKIGIQKQYAEKLLLAFNNNKIKNISSIFKIKGIGIKTFEKLFDFYFERGQYTSNNETDTGKLFEKHI